MSAGVTAHLLDELQETRPGLGRRFLPLEDLDHPHALLLTLQRAQDDQVVGRQFEIVVVVGTVSARLAVLHHILEQPLVQSQRVGIVVETGRRQLVVSHQLDLARTVLEPDRTGPAADRADHPLKKQAEVLLRVHPLLRHLLDFTSKLDDPLTDFVDVACGHRVKNAAKKAKRGARQARGCQTAFRRRSDDRHLALRRVF